MNAPAQIGLKNISELITKLIVSASSRRHHLYSTKTDENDNHSQRTKTVDEDEIRNFSILADRWWNEFGEFKALHSLNKIRVPFVRDGILNTRKNTQMTVLTGSPLKGIKILDIGCGGGILSEPLARLGAEVVGLDASKESIGSAKHHAERMTNPPKYVCETIEDHAEAYEGFYDAVVLSEVLEHIQSKDFCLQLCNNLLKPQGSIFITTINQNMLSWLGVILAAEYLLRFIPPNTHQYNKFITPRDLRNKLINCGFETRLLHGMSYNIVCNKWHWTSNTSINYALHAVKYGADELKTISHK